MTRDAETGRGPGPGSVVALLVLGLGLWLSGLGESIAESAVSPGAAPIERPSESRLAPEVGSRSRFAWQLAASEALVVEVREFGLDVHLEAHSGTRRWLVDGPLGGFGVKSLTIVANEAMAGEWILQANRRIGVGEVVIQTKQRSATAQDRRRAAASWSYGQGELARRQTPEPAWAAARDHFIAAAAAYRSGEAPRGAFLADYRLGTVERALGSTTAELEAHRRAESVALRHGLNLEAGVAARRLGWIHHGLGRYDESIAAYRRAVHRFDGVAPPRTVAFAWSRLARSCDLAGRLPEAHLGYREARDVYQREGDALREARERINLGEIDLRLGRFGEALDGLREALRLAETIDHRGYQAIALTSIGTALRRLGRLDEAREHFEASYRLHLEVTDPTNEDRSKRANTLIGLGLTALRSGSLDAAETAFRSALELTRALGDRRSEAAALVNLAEVFEARGQPGRARAEADAALVVFDRLNDVQGLATAYFALARAERDLGRPAVAAQLQEIAVGHVEQIRRATTIDLLLGAYGAWKHEYYELLIELYLTLDSERADSGWKQRAFEVVERRRSRSLLESMGARRETVAGASSALVAERERQWLDAAEAVYRAIRGGASEDRLTPLRRRSEDLAIDLALLRQGELEPRAGVSTPWLDLAAVRALLDSETLLLEFFLGAETSWLWVVGERVFEVYALPGRERIETLATHTHRAIQADPRALGDAQQTTLLTDAGQLVLGPAAPHFGDGARLVIVAPGALQYLPFAALPNPRDPSRILAQDHRILHLPSASLLDTLRASSRRRAAADHAHLVAVLADPVSSPADGRWSKDGPAADGRRALFGPFVRLPASRREGLDLLERFPDEQRRASFGPRATRQALFGPETARASLVHIAAHAFVESDVAGLAGLVLSPSAEVDDGLIFAHDLYDLDLSADLVVVSACRTALGESRYGEGLGSLTHALLSSGAGRAMVTLWSVDDEATAVLMRHFYDAFIDHTVEAAEALRRAQLALSSDPRFRHPRHWAGFVLQGDW